MSVIGIGSTVLGGLATLYGAYKDAKSAKEQEAELARQRAANEAWYKRNYYQDYLNTVEAQNALKRYRNAWAEQTQQARARQAVTGGTPEQAQAVAEAGGEAMGNVMGTLAAQGQQNRQAIDAQKLAMDANLSAQEMAIAEAEQQAGANLINNGIAVATSALQGYEPKGAPTEVPKVETPVIKAPETSTRVNTPAVVGKEAGINPELIENPAEEEYEFYTKNPRVRY
jgi:hypothetical protein